MRFKICMISLVLVTLLLLPYGIQGEVFEEDDVRAYYGNPFVLELGNQTGGTTIEINYSVVSSWMGGNQYDFAMSILKDGKRNLTIEATQYEILYIVKESGNYSILWESTYHNPSDWKKFDYTVEVLETNQTDECYLSLSQLFTPTEFRKGSTGNIDLIIHNDNNWPIKLESLEVELDIESGDHELDLDDVVIASRSSGKINLSVPVMADELVGNTVMNIQLDLSMKVFGTWYGGLEYEWNELMGPSIIEKDTDGDQIPDNEDPFPEDPNEMYDSDGDGVGNNADKFPFDPSETLDSDNDGVGDNTDIFPEDSTEWSDIDQDGIGDNSDGFPKDPAASMDSDNDGYPDQWNEGKTADDSVEGLELDEYPNDGKKWKKTSSDSPFIELIFIPFVLLLVALFLKRRRDEE